MIAAIVAVDKNWGIGCNNALLAHIPEDMKFFKEKTSQKKTEHRLPMVVCGRKTYESIPNRPLPNRKNVVITRKTEKDATISEMEEVNFVTLESFLKWLPSYPEDEFNLFVIGGGEIYHALLPFCERIYVTKLEKTFEADTFFPNLDEKKEFILSQEGERKENKGIFFRFLTYERKQEGEE